MSFLKRVALASGSNWFLKDALPAAVKKVVYRPESEVLTFGGHNSQTGTRDVSLADPENQKGLVLYSKGDYFSAPKKYFVVQMTPHHMWWIRDITTQSNYASWSSQHLTHTSFQAWHKDLKFHRKPMTVREFKNLRDLGDLE